ncbi:MAG TPA: BatA domain-containing protein, partial [Luteolibacter sp.]|nr:BatA domain-containing protein [Luteolibacter sp.]
MPLLFANPWGLLALLGLPVILAIHFLHRHRRAIPISTLFLLEIAREPARSGHRWHRLIPSIPMWLQLLLVLLLAGLLSKPYLPRNVLQVAVILDDSASMRAFQSELVDQLSTLQRRTSIGGRASHWLVLSANPTRPRYYSGSQPDEWIAKL